MSLIPQKDDTTSWMSKQLKLVEDNNKKMMAENIKMREQISQILTIVQEQKTENTNLKKAMTEMKKDYDLQKFDDKLIAQDKADKIKNWHADRGRY
jgi:hypothetical protein